MSEPSDHPHEIAEAAATGAAAAVQQVQNAQETETAAEEAIEHAQNAAAAAAEASETATAAHETSAAAADVASQAHATATDAAVSLGDVHERVGRIETEQREFIAEARGFFSRLQDQVAKPAEPEVQQVEVTPNASSQASDSNPPTQDKSESTGNRTASPERSKRHRFGR